MSEKDFQSIVTTLPKLSEQELRHVRGAIDEHLLQPSGGQQSIHDDDWQFFYDLSIKILSDRGLRCPPWHVFQRMEIFRHFQKHFPEIQKFTEDNFGQLKRPVRQRLYRIYAELLTDWMEHNPRIPMKIGVYFLNLGMTPELVHNAFPGYAQQGWLPMVLQLGTRDHGLGDNNED